MPSLALNDGTTPDEICFIFPPPSGPSLYYEKKAKLTISGYRSCDVSSLPLHCGFELEFSIYFVMFIYFLASFYRFNIRVSDDENSFMWKDMNRPRSDPWAERCPVAFSSLYPSLSGVSAPFSSSFPAGRTEKSGLHVILGACAARVLQALIPINCREQEVRFILHDRVMFWGFNKLPLSLCWVDFPRPGKTKMFALFPSPFSNDSGKLIFFGYMWEFWSRNSFFRGRTMFYSCALGSGSFESLLFFFWWFGWCIGVTARFKSVWFLSFYLVKVNIGYRFAVPRWKESWKKREWNIKCDTGEFVTPLRVIAFCLFPVWAVAIAVDSLFFPAFFDMGNSGSG